MASLALVTTILPVGAIISALSQQVLNTAIAAQDVLVDQESFKILSRYLGDINNVLNDFHRREISESPAIRAALENMRSRVIEAQAVINSAKGKSKFYLLMHCRTIVKNAQVVTRGVGKALQLLLVAGAEVNLDIGEHVHRLKDRMVTAEFEASALQSHVMNELERGLQENKTDQGFANDLLRNIAQAVGVPAGEDSLRSELASFQKEMEEVAVRKQDQEKAFMEQVIAILYRAEAVSPPEDSHSRYKRLSQKANGAQGSYPPFPSFICPLTKEVMSDPVILGTPQNTEFTYERSAIVNWLEDGNDTDPRSGVRITKIELRPNNSLRESIKEWAALNDIVRLLSVKEMILSGEKEEQKEAILTVFEFCEQNSECKDWIGGEGVLDCILCFLKSSGEELKEIKDLYLDAVIMIVTDNEPNKEVFAEIEGLLWVMRCLSTKPYRSKGAALLRELSKSRTICDKIPDILGAILSLVTLYIHYEKDSDVGANLRFVLEKLTENDRNVVAMAKANWCHPLIKRLATGSDVSKMRMANYLANIPMNHIGDDNKMMIGEGAIYPLLTMCKSGKTEAKMAALESLSNLSGDSKLRTYIAAAGALPVVLELQVSLMYPLELREKAASVLANLCSGNGVKYFMDAKKGFLPLYQAVEPFLHFQEVSSSIMRLHVLRALLGMAQEKEARHLIRTGKGIPVLLSVISGSDIQARSCALRLLYYLSEEREGAVEIAYVVEKRNAVSDVVRLLMGKLEPYAQAAAAGLLMNLPLDQRPKLQNSFLASGVIAALITLAKSDDAEVQENAVGALRQFTWPSDLEAQKSAANLDIHPVLVRLLRTGSLCTKARAAQVLRNFSMNTSRLVTEPKSSAGWMCFMKPRNSLCRVHKGKCSVKGTFCLMEAEAVTPLVSLLEMAHTEAAEAGVEALETLVADETEYSGSIVLHEVQGIQPLFRLLTHGSPISSDKAVQMLEHIFNVPRMKEIYERSARVPLVTLSLQPNNGATKNKSIRLLARMELGMIESY